MKYQIHNKQLRRQKFRDMEKGRGKCLLHCFLCCYDVHLSVEREREGEREIESGLKDI